MNSLISRLIVASVALSPWALCAQNVRFEVDVTDRVEEMKPIWTWFGYDEPNYTYMKDGKKLLSELSSMSPVPVYVRAHNLLTSGDGTAALKWGSTNAYTEDEKGRPVYDWTIVDSIVDTYVNLGMRPLMEIGFMPEDLSSKPQPYRHHWTPNSNYNDIYTGWTQPPKDYDKWRDLVYEWVRHSVERYGKEEVESWYWEVWNEPNIGYWSGSFDEYCKLYDYAADGLKKALPTARIGGPETTDPSDPRAAEYLCRFLDHCVNGTNYATGKKGSPLEYISFHAKGGPRVIDGRVRMNIGRQLRNIDRGFEIVASFPELKNVPIVIGESDPEGCAACSVDFHPANAYRNGTMYSSYTASSFARKYDLARKHGVNFIGAVSWSFEFEDQKWFGGFRDLATNGVDKPVLNVFRMYGMMDGDLLKVDSSAPLSAEEMIASGVRIEPDVNALASAGDRNVAVMVWNYHDDDAIPSDPARVSLGINKIDAGKVLVQHYRIDGDYSNSYEVWKKMGSPQNPTDEQIAELERAGHLALYTSPEWREVVDGKIDIDFDLPRQGVSLVRLTW